MSGLTIIEMRFRTTVCHEACIRLNDAFWYTDANNYVNQGYFHEFRDDCDRELDRSRRELFVKHYHDKYGLTYPPCWVMTELLPWGSWCKACKNLRFASIKKAVASTMGCHPDDLASWMQALNDLRNRCAHHARVWNRVATTTPSLPMAMRALSPEPRRVYILTQIMTRILTKLGFEATFVTALTALFAEYQEVDYVAMGKPASAQ